MKRLILILLCCSTLSLLNACKSSAPKPVPDPAATAVAPVPITASMQNMKITMEQLLPFLVDRSAFEAPQNATRIQLEIDQLNHIAKNVSHAEFKTQTDPSFGFLSEGFHQDIERSREAFNQDKKDFARVSLLNLTSYCIECHTRTASGPAFQSPELSNTLLRLPPLERGEYLLSVRQFDAALTEFMKLLQSGLTDKFSFYEFDRALRDALAITVKFQRDPIKTEKIIDLVSKSASLPYFIRQASSAWWESLKAWKKERPIKNPSIAQRIQKAEELVRRGRAAQQGQSDRSGDIDLLRGLSELHQILWAQLNKEQLGRVLLLTGNAYELVRDMTPSSLHENYYESCVRRVPHSVWARNCYKAIEESLFMGYTGSSGTHIPKDVQARLNELEKLSEPPKN